MRNVKLAVAAIVSSTMVSAAFALPAVASTVTPSTFVLAEFGYDQGWRDETLNSRHPRTVADITGDGLADIVGFGDAGVWVATALGNGRFSDTKFAVANFGYDQGWRLDPVVENNQVYGYYNEGQHPRFVVDVTGDNFADIVGFGDEGVLVGIGNGSGSFSQPTFALADFGADSIRGAWDQEHPRFVVDITGDHRPDIVGIRGSTVWVAAGGLTTLFERKVAALTSSDFGGGVLHRDFRRFLQDVNADGRPDLIMIGKNKVWVALSTLTPSVPFQRPYVAAGFGYETMTNIHVADITGDKRAEIFGSFGRLGGHDGQSVIYYSRGLHVSSIGSDGRYRAPTYRGLELLYSTVGYHTAPDPVWAVADMNGDGLVDLVGNPNCEDHSTACTNTHYAYAQGNGTFANPIAVISDFASQGVAGKSSKHMRFAATFTTVGHADIVGFGKAGTYVGLYRPLTGPRVPDVRGKTVDEAAAALVAAGFVKGTTSYLSDPTCQNIGLVTSQSPAAGTIAVTGTAVNLTVGAKPATPCP